MALRLRVLAGRHRGAEFDAAQGALKVGADDECDITLTDPGIDPVAFELLSGRDGLRLRPLGLTQVNGATVTTVTAVRAGDVIACGGAELAVLASRVAAPQAVAASSSPPPAGPTPPRSAASPAARRRAPVVMVLVLVGVLAAAALAVSAVLRPPPVDAAVASPHTPMRDPEEVQQQLVAAGFQHLRMQRDYRGNLTVTGLVPDAAELQRLEGWLATHVPQVRSNVYTGPALAAQLRAYLDDAGVQVTYAGDGRLRLEGRAQREGTSSKIVRWAGELGGAFEIENAVTYEQEEEAKAVAGKGRFPLRISQLNAGETPYLETSDGARYFEGSMLTDGSVIRNISADGVLVESNGRLVQYRMVD